MKEIVVNISKEFSVKIKNIEFKVEFFTKSYILKTLLNESKHNHLSVFICNIPVHNPFCEIQSYYKVHQDVISLHFAYIKFFEYDGEEYGIVGGKTNYLNPDIRFDYLDEKNDNRISRVFLNDKKLEWDREILIVDHKLSNHKEEIQEALFIETFLQRKFNLFNS